MLVSLNINNFVVAESIQLDFHRGFTVLLGETGAGKSVIVDALAVVTGSKANLSKIRDPEKKSFIEAVFELDDEFKESHEELNEYLGRDHTLILSVVFSPKGNVARKVNGESVTQGMLKKMTEGLIDIHSQGENKTLFTFNGQLEILDRFGGNDIESAKKDFQKAYGGLQEAKKDLEDFIREAKTEDPDFLRFRIEEIEKYHLKENEIEEDERKLDDLSGLAKMGEALKTLGQCVGGFEEINQSLRSSLSDFQGTSLEEKANGLKELSSRLEDGIEEMMSYSLENDPAEIDRLNARLFELGELRRKYGHRTSDILQKLSEFKAKLENLEGYEETKRAKEEAIAAKEKEALTKAKALSGVRLRYAAVLSKKVSSEMADLALPKDGFLVEIHPQELGIGGIDKVDFQICLNKGFKFVSLKEAASGGEGSRIMLSLKAVLQKGDPSAVMVFDEIDSGISGNTAFKAGKKMSRISAHSQVIAITHLPQVASFADNPILVRKEVIDGESNSSAKEVDKEGLVNVIANMLSGEAKTENSFKAATELIEEARKEKRP